MKRTRAKQSLAVAVAVVLLLQSTPVQARWYVLDSIYASAEPVCHDGMQVTAIWASTDDPAPADRLGELGAIVASPSGYGQLLALPATFQVTYHDQALEVDTDDPPDGTINYVTHWYTTFTTTWSRQLATGTQIELTNRSDVLSEAFETVQDCYLNRLAVNEGALTAIGPTSLQVGDGSVQRAGMVYQLNRAPAHGALLLNGAPLAAEASFTQQDVDSQRLTYQHDGSETTADSFGFTVGQTFRVSISSTGAEAVGGTAGSTAPSISPSGYMVAFQSDATNLVSGDTNGVDDVFVYRRGSGQVSRASVANDGAQANAGSYHSAIASLGSSPNSDFLVAFESDATNLVSGDTNGVRDIFGRDTLGISGQTTRFTVGSPYNPVEANDGSSSPAISADGGSVAFESSANNLVPNDTNNLLDIFSQSAGLQGAIRESVAGDYASGYIQANGISFAPSIAVSGGGQLVAFASLASNLANDDSNGISDIYVRNDPTTTRVSVAPAGAQANGASFGPSLSANGRYVAFQSYADNLLGVGGDNNDASDIYVYDLNTGTTTRVSLTANGGEANGDSFAPALSGNGRYVAFASKASNLVPDDTNGAVDIFVYDRDADEDGVFDEVNQPGAVRTTRVSVDSLGGQANGASGKPSISADGAYVAFWSDASNLVADDTNGQRDVFVRYLGFSSQVPIQVNPVDDPPTIAPIPDQTTVPGRKLGPIALSIADVDSNANSLSVTATSSNQGFVPNAAIVLGGSGAHRTLTVTPAALNIEEPVTVVITVNASDGIQSTSATFNLVIKPKTDSTLYLPLALR